MPKVVSGSARPALRRNQVRMPIPPQLVLRLPFPFRPVYRAGNASWYALCALVVASVTNIHAC